MIHFLIFYWLFSSVFLLGFDNEQQENGTIIKFTLSVIRCFIYGWLLFPVILGDLCSYIYNKKDNYDNKS